MHKGRAVLANAVSLGSIPALLGWLLAIFSKQRSLPQIPLGWAGGPRQGPRSHLGHRSGHPEATEESL